MCAEVEVGTVLAKRILEEKRSITSDAQSKYLRHPGASPISYVIARRNLSAPVPTRRVVALLQKANKRSSGGAGMIFSFADMVFGGCWSEQA